MVKSLPDLGPSPAILFITATRIGDAVLSTGLLGHLLDRYPDARLTITAGSVSAPLFHGTPGLQRLITLTKRPYAAHWLDLYRATMPVRWSLVVDLRGSALAFLLRTRHRRIMAKGDPRKHRVAQLARLFGLSSPPAPRLWLTPEHVAAAERLIPEGGPILAIGPAANWRGKQWRAERFADLTRRLTAPGRPFAGARVAVLAAAHERAQVEPVLRAIPAEQRLDLVGEVDLLTAAACLGRAAMFIGNDSGLMHMAAAMGVPTLGLFGPSLTAQYAPWGPHASALETPIPYATLVGAPDFDHRTTDTLMDSLTVDAVEAAVEQLVVHNARAA
ncbi:MAG TPA: glycosyltransferase family 9 protein [Stellaceae bacterium]|nr:glycosyltransferase family 9 protein [Stellaceae bacterium]